MIFRKSRCKITLNDLIVDNVKIENTSHTKFIGIVVDQHLKFGEHIKYLKGKISRSIGVLYKAKKYLKETSLLTIYNAFINPYFMYCITVWGNTYQTLLDPLLKLQKRSVRLVIGADRYDHTFPIFQKLNILNLRNMYLYSVLIFLYKYDQQILSESLFLNSSYSTMMFTTIRPDNNTISRHTPFSRCYQSSNALRSSGVEIHNYFRNYINFRSSFVTFKYEAKKYILSHDITHL